MRNLGKVGVAAVFAVGVFDIIDADVVHAEEIDTRNASLDGTSHAVTGLEYATNNNLQFTQSYKNAKKIRF